MTKKLTQNSDLHVRPPLNLSYNVCTSVKIRKESFSWKNSLTLTESPYHLKASAPLLFPYYCALYNGKPSQTHRSLRLILQGQQSLFFMPELSIAQLVCIYISLLCFGFGVLSFVSTLIKISSEKLFEEAPLRDLNVT